MDASKVAAGLPRPGDTIAGKYVVVRVIGEGGMGVVYEATHQRLRRRVAVKMLLPHMIATSTDLVARFEREARAAGQLRDKHITKVLDVDTTSEGLPYLVMEYLEGHDLDAELGQRGPLPIAEAVGYVLQVCAAMAEAHAAGIVHRDLKPSNLFLTPDRDGWLVKVLDFGISKMADEADAKLTGTQTTVGTPLYMSPEQVRSSRNVDSRSDIWSLGVILYELLAGRTPFEGSTTAAAAAIVADPTPPLQDYRPEVAPELQAVIHHSLSKDPNERYQTVAEFAQAITPFAGAIRPSMMPPRASSPAVSVPVPTPAPSTPSYPRAPEHADTVSSDISQAGQASPSGTSLAPATTGAGRENAPRRSLVAVGGMAAVVVVGIVVVGVTFVAGRGGGRQVSAPAVAPAGAPSGVSAMVVPPASSPGAASAPPAPPSAPPPEASTAPAVAAPAAKPGLARPGIAASPPGPKPPSKPAPSPPAASAAPTHAPANPLFL